MNSNRPIFDYQPQCLKCEKKISGDEYYENKGKCDTCEAREEDQTVSVSP